METNDLKLSIEGDALATMKKDFDDVLIDLVDSMRHKNVTDSTLTCKLSIKLMSAPVPTYENGEQGNREATVPVFKHDISSTMTVKNKVSGMTVGVDEIIYDKTYGGYVLRKLNDGQMRFDEYGNIINPYQDSEDEIENAEPYSVEEVGQSEFEDDFFGNVVEYEEEADPYDYDEPEA
ncbi:MAG: hypothetical protein LUD12_14025 [Lachnospiraceae bacterium]|nr:hypothetical protein [Lachnospiraceae bacterium]